MTFEQAARDLFALGHEDPLRFVLRRAAHRAIRREFRQVERGNFFDAEHFKYFVRRRSIAKKKMTVQIRRGKLTAKHTKHTFFCSRISCISRLKIFQEVGKERVVPPREPSSHKSSSGSFREAFINSIEAFTSSK